MSKAKFLAAFLPCTLILAAQQPASPKPAVPLAKPAPACQPSNLGSPYIPVDNWIYPAVLRLYSLGYVDTVFLGMRPWTRASVSHMIEQAGARIEDADASAASDESRST